LKSNGIISTNVLFIDASENGKVIWYTKSQKRQLYFTERLSIPNGQAHTPPLLWCANKRGIRIFALATNRRPTAETQLCMRPFLMFMKVEMSVWEVWISILKILHHSKNL
jgi:hypothetical protein